MSIPYSRTRLCQLGSEALTALYRLHTYLCDVDINDPDWPKISRLRNSVQVILFDRLHDYRKGAHKWKGGRIESPTYCGGTGAYVHPFDAVDVPKFEYVMTADGVMTVYGDPPSNPRYEKTELCKALDAILWPEET